MTMKAKFPGTCNACSLKIQIGEEIEFIPVKGGKNVVRHATINQCADAKKAQHAKTTTPNANIDLSSIAKFLHDAKERGLASPKLRVLAPNGREEMRLSITKHGTEPGSIAVVVAHDFVGCIRQNGTCTSKVSQDQPLQKHLLTVAKDPISAAKEYAALTGNCSFCSKPLTDAGSVEVGYGPICAKHWGLPHTPKGTPALFEVPVSE